VKALAMEWVYDISRLGLGHVDGVHRTGILRVVERQAQDLLGVEGVRAHLHTPPGRAVRERQKRWAARGS
jgi:hypothetical protein